MGKNFGHCHTWSKDTTSQRNSITTSQFDNIAVSQHYSVTTLQCHNITMSQHHNVTTSQSIKSHAAGPSFMFWPIDTKLNQRTRIFFGQGVRSISISRNWEKKLNCKIFIFSTKKIGDVLKADIKVGSQSLGRDSGLKLKNLSEDHRTHFKNASLSVVFATPKDLKLI